MKVINLGLGLLSLTLMAYLTGCVSSAQKARVFPDPVTDKGLVYFYLEGGILETTASYSIEQDNVVVGDLPERAYLYVFAEPGSRTFSSNSEPESKVTVNITAGETYYIECVIKKGLFVGHPRLKLADVEKSKRILLSLSDVTK